MRTALFTTLLALTLACEGADPDDSGVATDSGTTEDTDTSDTDGDTDTSDTDTSDTSEPVACDAQTPDACAQDSSCAVISGREVTGDCIDYSEPATPLGCHSADTGCGDAETWASAPDSDSCVLFSSTCLPSGWTSCDWQDTQECQ